MKSLELSWDIAGLLFLCCLAGIVLTYLFLAYSKTDFKLSERKMEMIISAVLAAVFSLLLVTSFGLYVVFFLLGLGILRYVMPWLIRSFTPEKHSRT